MKDDNFVEGLVTEYPEFNRIILRTSIALLRSGINPVGKCVYYRRENSRYSTLHIQYRGTDKEKLENCIVFERNCIGDKVSISCISRSPITLLIANNSFVNEVRDFFDSMEEKFDGIIKDFTIDKEEIIGSTSEKEKKASMKFTMGKKYGNRK